VVVTSTENKYTQFVIPNVSYSDIVPEDIQNELMSWRDVFTLGYFAIGDIANELTERSTAIGLPVTNLDVHRAVGRFCGKSARTVRYYAEMANFFPVEVRQEFDMLPFTHFRFARTLGRRHRQVLEFAQAHPDFSEEGLRQAFASGAFLTSDFDLPTSDHPSVNYDVPDASGERVERSRSTFASTFRVANVIGDLIENLRGLTEGVMLRRETASRLAFALEEIRKCLPEIMEAVKDSENPLISDYSNRTLDRES
jgi:hypothetical protein